MVKLVIFIWAAIGLIWWYARIIFGKKRQIVLDAGKKVTDELWYMNQNAAIVVGYIIIALALIISAITSVALGPICFVRIRRKKDGDS